LRSYFSGKLFNAFAFLTEYSPIVNNHRLLYWLPRSLISFDPNTFALKRQFQQSNLPLPLIFLYGFTNINFTHKIPITYNVLKLINFYTLIKLSFIFLIYFLLTVLMLFIPNYYDKHFHLPHFLNWWHGNWLVVIRNTKHNFLYSKRVLQLNAFFTHEI